MKATSAAPRYVQSEPGVPQRFVIEKGLVDHGTTKNNPIRDILYECRKLFRYANDMMIIVSVGTGAGLDRKNEIPEMANSVEDRKAEARTWGEKFEAEHAALMERNWMKYFRFDVTGLEDVPLEEWSHVPGPARGWTEILCVCRRDNGVTAEPAGKVAMHDDEMYGPAVQRQISR